jgi:hypothetical protein
MAGKIHDTQEDYNTKRVESTEQRVESGEWREKKRKAFIMDRG